MAYVDSWPRVALVGYGISSVVHYSCTGCTNKPAVSTSDLDVYWAHPGLDQYENNIGHWFLWNRDAGGTGHASIRS